MTGPAQGWHATERSTLLGPPRGVDGPQGVWAATPKSRRSAASFFATFATFATEAGPPLLGCPHIPHSSRSSGLCLGHDDEGVHPGLYGNLDLKALFGSKVEKCLKIVRFRGGFDHCVFLGHQQRLPGRRVLRSPVDRASGQPSPGHPRIGRPGALRSGQIFNHKSICDRPADYDGTGTGRSREPGTSM